MQLSSFMDSEGERSNKAAALMHLSLEQCQDERQRQSQMHIQQQLPSKLGQIHVQNQVLDGQIDSVENENNMKPFIGPGGKQVYFNYCDKDNENELQNTNLQFLAQFQHNAEDLTKASITQISQEEILKIQKEQQNVNSSMSSQSSSQLQPQFSGFEDIEKLDRTTEYIDERDFSSLYQNKKIIKVIKTINKSKYYCPDFIRQVVKKFLDTFNARIKYFPFSQIVYRQLLNQVQKMQVAFQYNGNRRNVAPFQIETNRIYQHVVQEFQTKPRRQAIYYVQVQNQNRRISLGQYFANCNQYFKNSKWRSIIDKVQTQIEINNVQENNLENAEVKRILKKMDYSKNIYKNNVMNISCLGCTPYFIAGCNIYDQTLNKVIFAVAGKIINLVSKRETLGQIEQRQKIQTIILYEICGLLNFRGGIILFDCERVYTSIIPVGQLLIREQAQSIKETLQNLLGSIYPRPKFEENVKLELVRIMKNPLEQDKQAKTQGATKQEFYQNLVMVRIIVRPTVNQVYKVKIKDKYEKVIRYKSFFEHYLEKLEVETPQFQKQTTQTITTDSSDIFSRILNKADSQFDHQKCFQSQFRVQFDQLPEKRKDYNIQVQDPEKVFDNYTAMVVKKEFYEEFCRKIKQLKFEHFVEFPFPQSKIKGANATIILYHNKKNAQLSQLLNKNNFQFGGRSIVTVHIVDCVKLISRLNKNYLPLENLKTMQLWLDNEVNENERCLIKTYKYVNDYKETEYFLKVEGPRGKKKCILFLYLLTNHYGQKSQLRNPKELAKLVPMDYQKKN